MVLVEIASRAIATVTNKQCVSLYAQVVELHCGVLFTHVNWHQMCTVSVFIVATVTIDIERRVIDVIENQTFVEVCLVKSGPSSRPVMALVNADELTGNAGSPGGRPSV